MLVKLIRTFLGFPLMKNKLIVTQQLKIQKLEDTLTEYKDAMGRIHGLLFSIGAPLNDSIINYTKEQRHVLYRISECIVLENTEE